MEIESRQLPSLLRLDRLGEGRESAEGAVGAAKAVVNEVGAKNVHRITKRVAKLSVHNANRDMFRFIRLPLDLSWVTCPVLARPGSTDIIEQQIPMFDPHELLEYLWSTGRLKVDLSTIQTSS